MSIDVNEIMEMLDWKNQEDIQARGRILAANIRCLKIFMQPMDKQYNKNIWGNCARVLRGKTDTELSPYLFDLLNWIKDMNGPGAYVILERMKSFFEFEILAFVIKECVQIADAVNDEIGLSNMAELLEQEDLIPYLTKEIHLILLKNRDGIIVNLFYGRLGVEVNTSVYGVSVEGNASVTITNKLQYKQGTLSTKTVASKNMGGNILEVKMRDTIISILKGKKGTLIGRI